MELLQVVIVSLVISFEFLTSQSGNNNKYNKKFPILSFNVLEEQPPKTFVGDIKSYLQNVSKIKSNTFKNYTSSIKDNNNVNISDLFVVLKDPNMFPSSLFSIDKVNGHLLTNRVLNREVLCNSHNNIDNDINTNFNNPSRQNINNYFNKTESSLDYYEGKDNENDCYFDLSVIVIDTLGNNNNNNKINKNKINKNTKMKNKKRVVLVRVYLDDVNDNNPIFASNQISLRISEGSNLLSRYPLPSAIDIDDLNAILIYSIQCNAGNYNKKDGMVNKDDERKEKKDDDKHDVLFELEDTSDGLYLVQLKELDRESIDKFICTVFAMDGGGRRGEMVLMVDVEDVNDHSPHFDTNVYSVEVSEGLQKGDVLLKVHASDADLGDNAALLYRMSESSRLLHGHFFSVDPSLGDVVLINSLDRERMQSHQFIVEAFDSGAVKQNSAFVRVSINVIDENDNNPVITVTSFGNDENEETNTESIKKFEIPENTEVERFVAFLSVSDNDEGKNGECVCKLVSVVKLIEKEKNENTIKNDFPENKSYLNHFKLTSYYEDGYKLETAVSLDRENVSDYSLQVHCSDQGSPQRSVSSLIHIHVTDVNDNRPLFEENDVRIEVEEGNEVGKLLATIAAIDHDSLENANTFYALQPMVNIFQNIKKMNDKRKIHKLKNHDSKENSLNDFIKSIDAEERLNYDVMNYVQLDEKSGHLIALTSFDYETMPAELNYKAIAYELLDSGESNEEISLNNWSWIPVIISIVDKNDELPIFNQPHYVFEVSENVQSQNNILGQVKATDADFTSPFNKVLFELMPSVQSGMFQLNQQSGILSTSAMFDREVDDVYDLVIRAYNPASLNHSSSLSSSSLSSYFTLVNVTIKINDKNDNAPLFKFPSKVNNRITIPTSHAVGGVVCVVEAFDEDEVGANSKTFYSIIKIEQFGSKNSINSDRASDSASDGASDGGSDRGFDNSVIKDENIDIYKLDRTSGEIVTLKALNHEITYKLTILAEDGGQPSLSSLSLLFIHVNNSKLGQALVQEMSEKTWHWSEHKYLLPLLFTLCCSIGIILCLVLVIATAVMCRRKRKAQRNKESHSIENSMALSNSYLNERNLIHSSLLTSSSCAVGTGYGRVEKSGNWVGNEDDTWKELSVQSIESKQSCCSSHNCPQRHHFSPTSNEIVIKSCATTPLTTTSFCQYNNVDKHRKSNTNNTRYNSRRCCYNSCNSIRSCALVDDINYNKSSNENYAANSNGKHYESDTHEALTNQKVKQFNFVFHLLLAFLYWKLIN